jgi:hypothetical protein
MPEMICKIGSCVYPDKKQDSYMLQIEQSKWKGSGDSANRCSKLERFSNSRALNDSKESGFFLRKKPLSSRAFGVQQLENRYSPRFAGLAS